MSIIKNLALEMKSNKRVRFQLPHAASYLPLAVCVHCHHLVELRNIKAHSSVCRIDKDTHGHTPEEINHLLREVNQICEDLMA